MMKHIFILLFLLFFMSCNLDNNNPKDIKKNNLSVLPNSSTVEEVSKAMNECINMIVSYNTDLGDYIEKAKIESADLTKEGDAEGDKGWSYDQMTRLINLIIGLHQNGDVVIESFSAALENFFNKLDNSDLNSTDKNACMLNLKLEKLESLFKLMDFIMHMKEGNEFSSKRCFDLGTQTRNMTLDQYTVIYSKIVKLREDHESPFAYYPWKNILKNIERIRNASLD